MYRIEKLKNNNKPLFDFVNNLYVLILENSPYEKQVREQLAKYNLCKNMYLQWNKGYKFNNLPDTTTDLKMAFLYALKKNKNEKYVIILEEDFIIRDEFLKNINETKKFIINKNIECFLFGSLLFSAEKINKNFAKVCRKGGTHALLINNEGINKLIKNINIKYDIDNLTSRILDMYSPTKAQIIQIFNHTENQNNWKKGITIKNLRNIVDSLIKLLNFLGGDKKEYINFFYDLNYLLILSNNPFKQYVRYINYINDLIT